LTSQEKWVYRSEANKQGRIEFSVFWVSVPYYHINILHGTATKETKNSFFTAVKTSNLATREKFQRKNVILCRRVVYSNFKRKGIVAWSSIRTWFCCIVSSIVLASLLVLTASVLNPCALLNQNQWLHIWHKGTQIYSTRPIQHDGNWRTDFNKLQGMSSALHIKWPNLYCTIFLLELTV